MTRTAFLLFFTACTAALVQAQPLPSAESILDHFVEVTGGKAAYQKHTSEVLVGKVTFAVMGLSGQLTRYSAAPNKEYSVVELGPLARSRPAYPARSPGRRAPSSDLASRAETSGSRPCGTRASTAR